MHEFSMAQGILNAVLETAEENDANKVTDIVIQIGKLAMLNPEQLTFMLNVLIEDTIAENANIVIATGGGILVGNELGRGDRIDQDFQFRYAEKLAIEIVFVLCRVDDLNLKITVTQHQKIIADCIAADLDIIFFFQHLHQFNR